MTRRNVVPPAPGHAPARRAAAATGRLQRYASVVALGALAGGALAHWLAGPGWATTALLVLAALAGLIAAPEELPVIWSRLRGRGE